MRVEQPLGPIEDCLGSKGLSFHMKQKLWTMVLVLALLITRLNFFHGGMKGDGTLETQGQVCTCINHLSTQLPVRGSLECLPCDPVEEPDFHQQHQAWLCHCVGYCNYAV